MAILPSFRLRHLHLASYDHISITLDLAKINDDDSFPRTVRMLHFRQAVFSPILSRLVVFRRIMLNLP